MRADLNIKDQSEITEPLGIVVSDGGYIPEPTRFSAFIWGPVPVEAEATESYIEETEGELVAR